MPAPTFLCPIDGCNAEFRTDAYIKHLRSEHKGYLIKSFTTNPNIGYLNQCLKGAAMPFYLENPDGDEDDYYICFGTKMVYKKKDKAIAACSAHLDEHRKAWMELYLECVAPATMIDMIATKWQMYDKYETKTKRSDELERAHARVAEMEGALAAMRERLREERVGQLEAELAEMKGTADRFRYESVKFEQELKATKGELENVYRELDTVRNRHREMSLESAALGLQAMERTQSDRKKLEEHPKLVEKLKKYKKAAKAAEKDMTKRMMGMMMMMGGAGAGAGAGSVGSRRSVISDIDSDSDGDV
jgi:flagellar biosynthesis GTPase FlhF